MTDGSCPLPGGPGARLCRRSCRVLPRPGRPHVPGSPEPPRRDGWAPPRAPRELQALSGILAPARRMDRPLTPRRPRSLRPASPFRKAAPLPSYGPSCRPEAPPCPPCRPEAPPGPVFKGAVWELPGALPFPITAPRDTCCRPASAPPSLRLVLPLKALDLLLTATQGPSQRLPPDLSTCPLLATWAPAASAPRTTLPPSLSICPQLYFQPWRVGCCLGSAGRWWPTPFVFRSGQVLSPAWPPAHHSSGLLGPTSAPTKYTSQPGRVPLCLWTGQKGPGPPQASSGLCGPLGNGACSQGPMTGLFSVPSLLGHMLHMCNSVFSTLKKAHRWAPAPGP